MALVSSLSHGFCGMLLVGGVMGAAKGSMVSLAAAGGVAAALYFLEGYARGGNSAASWAQGALAGGLAGHMGARFFASGKVMPAGLVAAMSATMLVAYLLRALGRRA